MSEVKPKKHRIAWCITGAGDKIKEIIDTMKTFKQESEGTAEIDVYVSKNAETMLKFYNLEAEFKAGFSKVAVEANSNVPFLAGIIQSGRYDFQLIMPASSNTVAKIVNGIGDTLVTNTAIMALKAYVQVWVMPVDYKEAEIYTRLPNGKDLKLRVRKQEADQVRTLMATEDVRVFENPQKVHEALLEWLASIKQP
jgi:archaeoflavoprotein AfpA